MPHYNTIGSEFQVSFKLSNLTKQEKLNLLYDLLQDLGCTPKMVADKELISKFNKIWAQIAD